MGNLHTEAWLESMYMAAKEFAFGAIADDPDMSETELESETYNYLMSLDSFRKYGKAVDTKARQAANRVYQVTKGN